MELWKSDDFPFATWVTFVGFQPWFSRFKRYYSDPDDVTAFVQVGGPGVVEKNGGEAEDRGNEGEHIPLAKWEPTTSHF